MIRPTRGIGVFASAVALIAVAVRAGVAQAPAPANACALVTGAELQSALGSAVTLEPGTMGQVQTCSGETPTARVLVRFFKRANASATNEQAGIDAVKKTGGQVAGTNSGGIMCMSTAPPASMPQAGFVTSCTVSRKAPLYAVIEITAKTQKDAIPAEKLRPVAEKMASRF